MLRRRRGASRKMMARPTSRHTTIIGRQMATLDKNLNKAKRRLLQVDDDLVPVVSDHIRELTTKRDELQTSLKAAQTPIRTRLADVDAKVELAAESA